MCTQYLFSSHCLKLRANQNAIGILVYAIFVQFLLAEAESQSKCSTYVCKQYYLFICNWVKVRANQNVVLIIHVYTIFVQFSLPEAESQSECIRYTGVCNICSILIG